MNKEYYKVEMTEEETYITADIHKKIIETIAENIHPIKDKQKQFEIITLLFAVTISNSLSSLRINNLNKIKEYMDDLSDMVIKIHNSIKETASYMEYKNGKKVNEGRFN